MLRQLGRPTVFLTMSANEIGWTNLLKLLYKLKNQGVQLTEEQVWALSYIEKCSLINEDPVTCAIYFNKLVNVVISILQPRTVSPFGKYRVVHYFKRIEFQYRGSPHAHILLWLDNAPEDVFADDCKAAIDLINHLVSVSKDEASGKINLQTHKHTFTCYKNLSPNQPQKCRFEAPFMPSKTTMILTPMQKEVPLFKECAQRYKTIRSNLLINFLHYKQKLAMD